MKETDPNSKDVAFLKDAQLKVGGLLEKINKKTGVESNRTLIKELSKKLVLPDSRDKQNLQKLFVDLNLPSTKRKLLYSARFLWRRPASSEFLPVKAFLFDNGILVTKANKEADQEETTLKIVDVVGYSCLKVHTEQNMTKPHFLAHFLGFDVDGRYLRVTEAGDSQSLQCFAAFACFNSYFSFPIPFELASIS